MNVDFIIVGQGLAGTCFAFELIRQKKTFIIIDQYVSTSPSQVALGVYNPIILKWFTKPWKIDEQLNIFYSFYDELSQFLNISSYNAIGIYKYLNTAGDQNNWLTKSKSAYKSQYMSSELFTLPNKQLINSHFYGYINHAGRIDVQHLLKSFRDYCLNINRIIEKSFIYKELIVNKEEVIYNNITAKNIIFCEGPSAISNPYFNKLNYSLNKGETVTILSKELNLNQIIHAGLLLVPLGHDKYIIGSTYDSNYMHKNSELVKKEELLFKLNKIIKCSYQILDQQAGLRPSTNDRRPLIGAHSHYNNMYILNGLGTRGVLLAPYLSHCLAHNIYHNKLLDTECNINRIQ